MNILLAAPRWALLAADAVVLLALLLLYLDWRQTRLRIFPSGRSELNPVIRRLYDALGLHGITLYFLLWVLAAGVTYVVLCWWPLVHPILFLIPAVPLTAIEAGVVLRNDRLGIKA